MIILSRVFWGFALLGILTPVLGIERLRQANVIYLEDYTDKVVELKTLKPSPLSAGSDGSVFMGPVRAGQTIRVIGLLQDRFLVQAVTTGGTKEGWLLKSDVEPFPEKVWEEMQKNSANKEKLNQAIAKKEIVIGMDQDTVLKILGKPTTKSSITEASGKFDQWTYTTYKNVPVQVQTPYSTPGQTVLTTNNVVIYNTPGTSGYGTSTVYRKVAVGSKIVTFQDKKVIRFETKEDDSSAYQKGQIMIPPVYSE